MRFIEGFLSPAQARDWLQKIECADWLRWQRETFPIFGRQVEAPRSLAWFGDPGLNYRYTGIDHTTQGWPSALQRLRQDVESATGQGFNFLLMNRYASGSEYMGWHRDDEKGCSSLIASLSLGAPRRLCLEHAAANEESDLGQSRAATHRTNLELGEGSLLLFDGRQRHCLRATKKNCGLRINLTFRQISA